MANHILKSLTFNNGGEDSYTLDITGKLDSSLKGAPNGLAELDQNGKVPSSQLPSYVDDVLEFQDVGSFPPTGETGKIYVDVSTNLSYRWSGTTYIVISQPDFSMKADKTDTVLDTTLSRGRLLDSPVGTASFAFGVDVTASGIISHAEGYQTTASGNDSHAEGYKTTASAYASHSEGFLSKASDEGAHAEGCYTQAVGIYSHAEGYSTSYTATVYGARGKADHVEGYNTLANSGVQSNYFGAHAEGYSTKARSIGAHAEGGSTDSSGDYAHAEGYSTVSSGGYSHAEGNRVTAYGEASHAEGRETRANGPYAHAEGQNTMATERGSHAEGINSYPGNADYGARGKADHAEGYNTLANSGSDSSSYAAHAEGYNTTATGRSSHAEGYQTRALGSDSHAEGSYTLARSYSSHAEGQNSVADATSAHAEGYNTHAYGSYGSHAEGYSTYANASASHAEGYYTTAALAYQHVGGKFNVVDNSSRAYRASVVTDEDAIEYNPEEHGMYEMYSDVFKETVDGVTTYYLAHNDVPPNTGPVTDYNQAYWHLIGTEYSPPLQSLVPDPDAVQLWDKNTLYPVNSIVKAYFGDTLMFFQNHNPVETLYIPLTNTAYFHSQGLGTSYAKYDMSKYHAEIIGWGQSTSDIARLNIRALDVKGNEFLKGDLYVNCEADSSGGYKVATLNQNGRIPENQMPFYDDVLSGIVLDGGDANFVAPLNGGA